MELINLLKNLDTDEARALLKQIEGIKNDGMKLNFLASIRLDKIENGKIVETLNLETKL